MLAIYTMILTVKPEARWLLSDVRYSDDRSDTHGMNNCSVPRSRDIIIPITWIIISQKHIIPPRNLLTKHSRITRECSRLIVFVYLCRPWLPQTASSSRDRFLLLLGNESGLGREEIL